MCFSPPAKQRPHHPFITFRYLFLFLALSSPPRTTSTPSIFPLALYCYPVRLNSSIASHLWFNWASLVVDQLSSLTRLSDVVGWTLLVLSTNNRRPYSWRASPRLVCVFGAFARSVCRSVGRLRLRGLCFDWLPGPPPSPSCACTWGSLWGF
ncbi:hypothetical protein JOL62DRAFT_207144 [Phyllosticta paracitricarpa]|uniref:Uncharacterized protein n=1 Tax=Phyllosticta paracitricarpa TaxID=2016321 RepID=A0ABR1N449_9PEZI